MAPAPTSTSTSTDGTKASHSSSRRPTTFITVDVTPRPTFLTTTITTGGGGSLPTVGAVITPHSSGVPVAAIASGTAAGVVIALAAVIGWTWWGRCIKRKQAKNRKEVLAYLEVRENTRKNASSLARPASQNRPPFSIRGSDQSRKVKFASSGPASSQSTLRGTAETKKGARDAEKVARPPMPRPPTPSAQFEHARGKSEADVPPLPPPPVPSRSPQRERRTVPSLVPTESSYTQHRLMHQASTLSSGSVYSTQSAIEERQTGVPSSLLLALTNESNRRSLLATYLPWNRNRTSTASGNRLSEYSTGSVYSQFDDQPWESVGFAYGGEDELERR